MLNRLTLDDKIVLESWIQDYLREMAHYYGDTSDENGRFAYPYLPLYFSESDRYALSIAEGGLPIGFLLVNHVDLGNLTTDYSLAEFTVFPQYRGKGRAEKAIRELMKMFPGTWQLKYTTVNPAAAALWRRIEKVYGGKTIALSNNEVLLTFDSQMAL